MNIYITLMSYEPEHMCSSKQAQVLNLNSCSKTCSPQILHKHVLLHAWLGPLASKTLLMGVKLLMHLSAHWIPAKILIFSI